MLSIFDSTNKKRTWYYTDDVTKFSNNINNKEHQIEDHGFGIWPGWLREVIINNKGDIIPNKLSGNANYKQSYFYCNGRSNSDPTFVGGYANSGSRCGLLCIDVSSSSSGFVKVTILDT